MVTYNTTPVQNVNKILIVGSVVSSPGPGIAQITTNNVSGSYVTSTGSTTPRTLADRTAEVINVLDYGVVCDGSAGVGTDNTANFQKAINAGAGVARIYIPPQPADCETKQLSVPANSHIIIDGTVQLLNGANASGTAQITV